MPVSVLIVDDDHAIRSATQEYLALCDYNTQSVASADEALNVLQDFNPDIVLTDIILTGMDGLELTKIIKSTSDTDIIVMTGYSADYSYEKAVNAGASDFIFKPFRFEELDLRIKRVEKERQLRIENARMLKKLEELAITDAMTRLYNSRHFFHQLQLEMDRHSRYDRPLSMLIIDIDRFKQYNDTWGHLEGDKVLTRIGDVISSCLRINDTAYRYGGDEFTVILPETRLRKACLVGERIRNACLAEHFQPEPGQSVAVTVSIGATEHLAGETLESFVKKADLAMYQSKEAGRNHVSFLVNA
ncbi:MAG: diguanylate cyclase [Pseudomonadota bacterium]